MQARTIGAAAVYPAEVRRETKRRRGPRKTALEAGEQVREREDLPRAAEVEDSLWATVERLLGEG